MLEVPQASVWKSKGLRIPSSDAGPGGHAAQCYLYLGEYDVCTCMCASTLSFVTESHIVTLTVSTLNVYLPAMCHVSAVQVDQVL